MRPRKDYRRSIIRPSTHTTHIRTSTHTHTHCDTIARAIYFSDFGARLNGVAVKRPAPHVSVCALLPLNCRRKRCVDEAAALPRDLSIVVVVGVVLLPSGGGHAPHCVRIAPLAAARSTHTGIVLVFCVQTRALETSCESRECVLILFVCVCLLLLPDTLLIERHTHTQSTCRCFICLHYSIYPGVIRLPHKPISNVAVSQFTTLT